MSDDLILVPIRLELPRHPVVLGQNGELFGQDPTTNANQNQDFWGLRDKLLASQNEWDLIDFLNECGYACATPDGSIKRPWKREWLSEALAAFLFERRDLLAKWMPLVPSQWRKLNGRVNKSLLEYAVWGTGRRHRLGASFGWTEEGGPFVTVYASDPLEAIVLTVHIDRLRGVKFKTCARPDCAKPFPVISRHRRRYCDWRCGHLMAVRKYDRKKS